MNKLFTDISEYSTSLRKSIIPIFIIAITIFVYWDIHSYNFINFDDNLYVTDNAHVKKGLSVENVIWAFDFTDNTDKTYWHPLTWISHMADCDLFGLNAGMHHMTSLLFHAINAVLLFLVFHQMTGAIWRSAFIATLFAIHPINVDSVVWISERKNVLSTFFWMLTMISYLYYIKQPGILRYLLILVIFILGLLAKPMLVTLPCVLLLMDFWPLRRFRLFGTLKGSSFLKNKKLPVIQLLIEKLPLFILSCFAIVVPSLSLQVGNQFIPADTVPMTLRAANALTSYIKYIYKIIWPTRLTIYYPFPEAIPAWQVFSAACILLVITIAAILLVKKAPYFIVGWLWYIGTLFPVIGFVQGGTWPEIADRWIYVPQIGIFIIFIWGGAAIISKIPSYKKILSFLVPLMIIVLMLISRHQVAYWASSITLFEHNLNVAGNNPLAHFFLGSALASNGQIDQAIVHYRQSLALKEDPEVHNNLGTALAQQGLFNQAVRHINMALKKNPRNYQALNNMGNVFLKMGDPDDAIIYFNRALNAAPLHTEIHNNIGNALLQKKLINKAILHFNILLDNDPYNIEANINMGVALTRLNKIDAAISHYQTALKTAPDIAEAHNNIGVLFLKKGRYDEAKTHFEAALRLNPEYMSARSNLKKLMTIISK